MLALNLPDLHVTPPLSRFHTLAPVITRILFIYISTLHAKPPRKTGAASVSSEALHHYHISYTSTYDTHYLPVTIVHTRRQFHHVHSPSLQAGVLLSGLGTLKGLILMIQSSHPLPDHHLNTIYQSLHTSTSQTLCTKPPQLSQSLIHSSKLVMCF